MKKGKDKWGENSLSPVKTEFVHEFIYSLKIRQAQFPCLLFRYLWYTAKKKHLCSEWIMIMVTICWMLCLYVLSQLLSCHLWEWFSWWSSTSRVSVDWEGSTEYTPGTRRTGSCQPGRLGLKGIAFSLPGRSRNRQVSSPALAHTLGDSTGVLE